MKLGAPILIVVLAACSSRTPAGPTEPVAVQLHLHDRGAVDATYYRATRPHAPALILMPLPGSQRDAWDPFARQAQRQGYAALAVDLAPARPNAKPARDFRDFTHEDWLQVLDVARAAKSDLLHRGADPANLAIAGAGITANLALQFADSDPDMQAVVLLSPGLDYEGIAIGQTIRDIGKRPIFIAVAEGDAYAHSSSLQLHDAAAGYCELRVYRGAAHGADLFSISANVAEQILVWLKPILVPQPT